MHESVRADEMVARPIKRRPGAPIDQKSEPLLLEANRIVPVQIDIDPVIRARRVVYENTRLQVLARKHKLNCMHWFANTQALVNAVPSVVTIYDIQAFRNLHEWSLIKRTYLRWMTKNSVRRAPVLLPMSHATARDLERLLHGDPSRMTIIPFILRKGFHRAKDDEVDSFRKRFNLPDRFWVYVAHFYPHKNHRGLLEAFHKLKEDGFSPWPLVLRGDDCGEEATVRKTIREMRLENQVIFLPRLAERELPILYSAATALVFPSLYEGGGIPVVEALACGCPVIAADIPTTREYASAAATYFDPRDPSSIARAIANFQEHEILRNTHRRAGLARAKEFEGERIISKLLEAYARASS